MSEYQSGRGNHGNDTPKDAVVRAHFRDEELFFMPICNDLPTAAEGWLETYSDHEWPTGRRGPFPFDYMAWITEKADLWQRCISN